MLTSKWSAMIINCDMLGSLCPDSQCDIAIFEVLTICPNACWDSLFSNRNSFNLHLKSIALIVTKFVTKILTVTKIVTIIKINK